MYRQNHPTKRQRVRNWLRKAFEEPGALVDNARRLGADQKPFVIKPASEEKQPVEATAPGLVDKELPDTFEYAPPERPEQTKSQRSKRILEEVTFFFEKFLAAMGAPLRTVGYFSGRSIGDNNSDVLYYQWFQEETGVDMSSNIRFALRP